MKVLLILWAVALTASEKLDRTYLPPPGSITAGGHHGDLEPPLEFQKENYPSTLEPTEGDSVGGGFSRPNFPNVAFGIDRQGPPVSSAEQFTTGPVVSASKNTFKVPTTTLPIEEVSETIGSASTQGIPSKTFSTDSNLDYPQQTDTDFLGTYVPGSVQYSESDVEKSTEIPYTPPNFQINMQYGIQIPRNHKTSLGTKDFSNTHYGDDINNISGATIPTASSPYPDEYYDEETSVSSEPNKTDQVDSKNQQYAGGQENLDGKKKYSPVDTLTPNVYTEKISYPTSVDIPSFGYGSTPKYSPTIDHPKYNIRTYPERVQADTDRNAVIINYENVLTPEGFAYSYDTSNGIHADESGTALDGVKAKGSYSYTGDDGKLYSIIYTADENGFRPRGDHLPTAPPIPDAILKVIEQAAINKQIGIIDDGSYDDAKYGHERYQGVISRRPQVQSNNIIGKQSINKEDNLYVPSNVEKDLDQVNIGEKNGHPYAEKHSYSSEYDNQVSPDNDQINNNGVLISGQVQDVNNPVFKGSLEQSTVDSKIGEGKPDTFHPDYSQQIDERLYEVANKNNKNNLRPFQNLGEVPHTTQVTIIRKGYGQDINQPSHTGYDYNHPHNVFNDNNGNNFKSQFSNTSGQNGKTEPEDKVNNEERTIKPFITPNVSFNFNSRKTDDAMVKRPLAQNINRPMTTSEDETIYTHNGNNDFNQPETPTFSNSASDNADDENIRVSDIKFSTRKPYEPTSSSPHSYQAPYTSKVVDNGRQRYYYPTPTLRSQYDSTTPVPSEISSGLTPSTNRRVYYSQTTPTQSTPTSRPSMTSETYRTTSQRPSDTGRINGVRLPTTGPDSSVSGTGYPDDSSRINDDGNYKRPTGQIGSQSDLKHRYGSTSRPNFGSQSSTERVVGEDFSGPKQSQRFDPDNGYYY